MIDVLSEVLAYMSMVFDIRLLLIAQAKQGNSCGCGRISALYNLLIEDAVDGYLALSLEVEVPEEATNEETSTNDVSEECRNDSLIDV